jgi:hypothetical protein
MEDKKQWFIPTTLIFDDKCFVSYDKSIVDDVNGMVIMSSLL